MKQIIKQAEPKAFTDWKALANEDWQPTYASLGGDTKVAVKKALIAEQGYICCYCERRLVDGDTHIEHFRPQRDPDVDAIDFNNLLCSCQQNIKRGEPRHCGNLKGDWFDSILLVSPLDMDCGKRFAFTANGAMRPQQPEDKGAVTTIEHLGLNIPKLKAMRSKAIEPFLDEYLSTQETLEFVHYYLQQDHLGQFGEFWSTIHYLFDVGQEIKSSDGFER